MKQFSKPTARAERRAALAKKKVKARRIYPNDPTGRLANHLAACSCHMCGNPRRHFKTRLIVERQADEAMACAFEEA